MEQRTCPVCLAQGNTGNGVAFLIEKETESYCYAFVPV